VKQTLYNIADDLRALESILLEAGGDISSPEALAAVEAWEVELETNLGSKIDNYCALISEIEARSSARKAEADRLADLARVDENAAKALRERLKFVFESRSLPTMQTERFRVSLARNGGKAPLDIRVGPDELPAWAVKRKTVVETDKDAIRARLEAGESLPFANLMERGSRLVIK
jgi:hypothetical protein